MSASPEFLTRRRPAARTLGPLPSLRELNLVCWGFFIALLVLPLAFVSYTHHLNREPLLKTGESDFVYLYGMGRLFNDHPAAELYDWAIQKQVCTEIHPIQKGEYGPIPYHPFVGILFRPFARLPYISAFLLWISLSLVAYAAGTWAVSGLYFSDNPLARSLILCFALSFYPFNWTMMAGHLSTLGFMAIAIALVQEHRSRPYLSGLALSVCVYKPTLLVLVLPMLVITRRFKTCAGFAAGSVALGLFATVVQGYEFWPGYFRMLFSFGRGAARVQTHTFKEVWKYVDALSFSSSISARLPEELSWLVLPLLIGFAVLSTGWLAWMWRKSEDAAPPRRPLVWAATLTWTLVLNVYVPIYDCVLAVIGVIVSAGVLKEHPKSRVYAYFTAVWLVLFGSSWFTTDVAEASGFQMITVFLAALGFLQLRILTKATRETTLEPPLTHPGFREAGPQEYIGIADRSYQR